MACPPKVRGCFAVFLMLPGLAQAHPFGDRYAAQRLSVDLSRQEVVVDYLADAPLIMLTDGSDEAALQAALDTLQAGLLLAVDGRTVPLVRRAADHRPDLVSMHTHLFHLQLVGEVPLAARHTVEVGNINLSGRPSFFLDEVTVTGSARVHASSLRVAMRDGTVTDLADAWSRSELRRRIRVDVELPTDPWSTLFDELDPARWPASRTHDRDPLPAWAAARRTPETSLLQLLFAMATGLTFAVSGAPARAGAAAGLLLGWQVGASYASAAPAFVALALLAALGTRELATLGAFAGLGLTLWLGAAPAPWGHAQLLAAALVAVPVALTRAPSPRAWLFAVLLSALGLGWGLRAA